MRADMEYVGSPGLRGRVAERVKATVRRWIEGHQITHFDSPAGVPMTWEYPSYPPGRVMVAVPGVPEEPVRVGKYTGIHYSAVIIPGGQHHLDWVGVLHAQVEDGEWVRDPSHIFAKGPVVIGSDVFIAFEALVNSGVTIGHGAVVAARAVVSKDVEPYSVVGGNPARHLKYRFDEPTREALLRIRWWDWPVETVTAHKHQINSPDVEAFVAAHDPDAGAPGCPACPS